MRISDWSSDVCSSDLRGAAVLVAQQVLQQDLHRIGQAGDVELLAQLGQACVGVGLAVDVEAGAGGEGIAHGANTPGAGAGGSEEHTTELQSLMRNSYAVFCLKYKYTNTDKMLVS